MYSVGLYALYAAAVDFGENFAAGCYLVYELMK